MQRHHQPSPSRLAHLFVLSLAFAVTAPATVHGGGGTPGAPRWSNDDHHMPRSADSRDCLPGEPGYRADYRAGRDAWGRPVEPADLPGSRQDRLPFPVEIEIGTGTGSEAGDVTQRHTGRVFVDPTALSERRDATQDCVSSGK